VRAVRADRRGWAAADHLGYSSPTSATGELQHGSAATSWEWTSTCRALVPMLAKERHVLGREPVGRNDAETATVLYLEPAAAILESRSR